MEKHLLLFLKGILIFGVFVVGVQKGIHEGRSLERAIWQAKVKQMRKELEKTIEEREETLKHLRPLGIRKLEVVVTAYSNDPYSINKAAWRDGRTATMKKAREGICAADWQILPPGTVLFVPGYGVCEVQDRGSAIKGDRIDLFFNTRKQALEWGRKRIEIIVVAEKKNS